MNQKYVAQVYMGNAWIDLTKPTSKAACSRKVNEGMIKWSNSAFRIIKVTK